MAIKINGNTVIDNNQNFSTTGNITMGNGNVVLGTTLDQLQVNFNTVVVANAVGTSYAVGNIDVSANITGGNLKSEGFVSAAGNIYGLNILSSGNLALDNTDMVTSNVNLNIGTQQAGGNIRIGNVLPGSIELGGNTTNATIKLGSTTSTVNIPGNVTSTGNIATGNTNSISIGSLTITDDAIRSTEHNITIGSPGNIGNVIIGGNLTVNGNTTTFNSNVVSTNDLTYNLANNATTSSQANGGGIEVGPVGSPFLTWLYDNTSNAWVSSGNISATGNITGNLVSVSGNITAAGNISGSRILGNAQQLGNVGQSFAVTNVNSADYIFNGVANDPTINLIRGQTYYFNMNCGNTHPLWIKTAPTLGTGNAYTSGVTNNGVFSGTITFQVPWDAPNLLYYQCQIHSGMGGLLQIVDGTMLQNGNSTVTVYTNGNVATTVAGTSNVVVVSNAGEFVTGAISASGNVSGGNLNVTGNIVDSGALTISTGSNGNITLAPNGTGVVVTNTDIRNGQSTGVGNIGASGATFNTIFAKATSAQYADLAEKYTADAEYAPGTVLVFGGTAEVTVNAEDGDTKVAGVVSTNPSYIMNSELNSEHVSTVALTGRVPTMIVGPVRKGDMMVAAGLGRARAETDPRVGSVIGKALEDFDGSEGTIEVVVGRF
jgi:hypothetical protein